MLVNNCVTDNANLPLAASQGKYLMDQILSLNGRMFPYRSRFTGDFNSNNILSGIYHIDSSDTYSNGPDNKPSYCNFIQFQGYHAQMIIDRSTIYLRKYAGNPPTWGTWELFNPNAPILYKANNSYHAKFNIDKNTGFIIGVNDTNIFAYSIENGESKLLWQK